LFERTNRRLYLPAVLVLSALVLALLPTVAEAKETAATPNARGAERVVVRPGDSLWSISSDLLGPNASPHEIAEETERIYALNRDLIGGDPNLIFANQELSLPPEAGQPAAEPTARTAREEASVAHAASADRAPQGGTARPAGEGGEASQAGADLLALPDVAAPVVPVVRPLASPYAARSPAASLLSDVRSALSSAVTALDDYSLAELRANLDRRQLGIGIIALTLLVAGLMVWKLPMRRNIGEAEAPAEAPDSREDAPKAPVTVFTPKQDTGGLDSEVTTAENRLAAAGVIGAVTGRRKHTRRLKRPRSRPPRGEAIGGTYSREIRQALSRATLKTRSPRSARRRAGKPGRGSLAMEAMPRGHLGGAWLAPEPSVPSANGESIPNPRLLLLSTRQWETLELAAEGLPNAQIARRLFITESTVKQHLRNAYSTLGLRNRREAAGLFGRDDQAGRRSAEEEVRS
jgi:DNA-binding CsgD family transcriptional regulator